MGKNVYAFQPRKIDAPHFVAETYDDVADRVGDYISGEQCDGCGNSCYRIEAVGHGSPRPIRGFSAKCAVDPTDPDEQRHPDPCGIGHPISQWDENEVVY